MFLLIAQRILLDIVWDIVYFPIWWYSAGAKKILLGCFRMIAEYNRSLAPGLWLKNIFVPMYGQYDWQGRLMSFFMRLVNIIGRSIALLICTSIILALFFVWLAFPLILSYVLVSSLLILFV